MKYTQFAPDNSSMIHLHQTSKGNYEVRVYSLPDAHLQVFFAQSYKRGEWTLYNRSGVQVMRDATMQALLNALLHSPVSYHQELTEKETV